jgi:hypothetical protein
VRASEERPPTHPHERVHVHDDGVLATDRLRRSVIRFGLIARIEQQLIRVREAGVWRDAVRTTLNTAEVAPMPSANVRGAAAVKPGDRRNMRQP